MTERILDQAGITGWRRRFTKPAEFIQVLEERERRERPIKIFALLALAGGGGVLFWNFLKKRRERKGAE
jgi:hypothetical protein